jgi:ABC-type methionine transport system ATPase subunit
LLADEPTGSVDTKTSDYILDVFRNINESLGVTVLIVTHDMQITKKVRRSIAMRDGRTSSEIVIREDIKEELSKLKGYGLEHSHAEYAVLDKTGRLQLPQEYLERMGLDNNRVKLAIDENGKIILTKPE